MWPRWRSPACCDAPPASSADIPSAPHAAPSREYCRAPSRRRCLQESGPGPEPRAGPCSRTLLFPLFHGDVRYCVPGIVDPDEQESEGHSADHEQRRGGMSPDDERRNQETPIGEDRKYAVPDPVLQDWLIAGLPPRSPDHQERI